MGGVAPGVALGDTPHECPVAVVGNTFPFAKVEGERSTEWLCCPGGRGGGWRMMKCSWGAVLVADLVTQLPELVNLAAGKASAREI